jgi:hypothetical protein
MNPTTEPTEKKQPSILYGVLAVGAFLAIIATGWMVLSPSALLHRQLASASSTPVQPAAPAPDEERLVHGRVLDAESGVPLRGASVWAGKEEIRTDEDGRFTTPPLGPGAAILVKSPGYELRRLVADKDEVTVALPSRAVRAAYLTYFGVADKTIRERVLELVARTELNAVVIDVKGDRGLIPYRTQVPLALEAGAQGPVIIKDFEGFIASLKARGIYTVARIVTFKDTVLAQAKPEWAIIDTRTGKPWIDNEKLAWVDPFREEVGDYNIAIAKEAIAKGFDEVQFDYVRFPTDGKLSAARYSQPNNSQTRLPAIAAFLAKARGELGPLGAFVGADVFGYTAFNENDTDIGQRVEELSVHLDYICPMVYPSGYHRGIPGVRNPVAQPYEIVKESVRLTRKRSATAVVVRPWLQDFRDYAFDKRIFGVPEIKAQLRGAKDGGAVGYMLWNPKNDYTGAALPPKATATARVTP